MATMNGNTAEGDYKKISNWMSARQLYYRLLNTEVNPIGYENFIIESDNNSVGQLENSYRNIYTTNFLNPVEHALVDNLLSQKESLVDSLSDEYVVLMLLPEGSRNYSTIRDLLLELRSLNKEIELIYSNHQKSVSAQLQDIQITNNNRFYIADFEIYEQTMIDMACKVKLNGFNSLDSDDWDKIINIAERCPDLYGEAVFRARNYMFLEDKNLELNYFENICQATQLKKSNQKKDHIIIYLIRLRI